MTDDSDKKVSAPESHGAIQDLWANPWGRTGMICASIAMVSWAIRETAGITTPVTQALSAVLVPLAVAFTLAYILTPIVDRMQKMGMRRSIAVSILYAGLGVLGALSSIILVPMLVQQSTSLAAKLVEEEWYHDRNGNMKRDEGEISLIRNASPEGVRYYFDANLDGKMSAGDTIFTEEERVDIPDAIGVRWNAGLVQQGMWWLQNLQDEWGYFSEPDESVLRFLDLYTGETKDLRALLSTATEFSETQSAENTGAWLSKAGLAAPDNLLVQSALEAFANSQPNEFNLSDEDRLAIKASLREELQSRRSDILAAFQTMRKGITPETVLGEKLRQNLETELSVEQRERSLSVWSALGADKDDDAKQLRSILVQSMLADNADVISKVQSSVRGAVRDELNAFPDMVGSWAKTGLTNISGILALSLNIVLVPIYTFFLILAMPNIRNTLRRYTPDRHSEQAIRIVHKIEKVVAAFFRGRIIVCLICALISSLGFVALGVPYGILFGILIGLATAIPLAGLVFLIPMILIMLSDGGDYVGLRIGLAIAVYTIVQTLEATVFTPTIMGHEVELHPVVLIIALLLCGNLLGVLGLILAVPIAATIRILLREFVLPRLRNWSDVAGTTMIRRAGTGPQVKEAEISGFFEAGVDVSEGSKDSK